MLGLRMLWLVPSVPMKFTVYIKCETAKQIWDIFIDHEGTNQVKGIKK